jgi:cytochrome P450 family 6
LLFLTLLFKVITISGRVEALCEVSLKVMDMSQFDIVMKLFGYFIFVLILLLNFWIYQRQKYFQKFKIPYIKSLPLLGVFDDVILGKNGFYDHVDQICNRPEVRHKPFFGMFIFHKPALMITDLDLIKRILVKDFNDFPNRYSTSDKHDPLGYYNLFAARKPLWKVLRRKFTPVFSSRHLKAMFDLVDKIGSNMVQSVHEKLDKNNQVEMEIKDLASYYATDVIASCAFGVEANSFTNPDGEFRRAAMKIFENTLKRAFELTAFFMLPQITKLFRIKLFSDFTSKFIFEIIPKVMSERVKNKANRNDFIDTLIELKEKNGADGPLTDDILIAQAAAFVGGGKQSFKLFSQTF